MKRDKIIYWVTTGLVSAMMVMSAVQYLTNPEIEAGFKHLGFPAYFRIELAIAKLIGVIVLLLPMVSNNIKEWAYGGFVITFISAFIAHTASGDGLPAMIMPLVIMGVLLISYRYWHKLLV